MIVMTKPAYFALRTLLVCADGEMFISTKNNGLESKMGIRYTIYRMNRCACRTRYSIHFDV